MGLKKQNDLVSNDDYFFWANGFVVMNQYIQSYLFN